LLIGKRLTGRELVDDVPFIIIIIDRRLGLAPPFFDHPPTFAGRCGHQPRTDLFLLSESTKFFEQFQANGLKDVGRVNRGKPCSNGDRVDQPLIPEDEGFPGLGVSTQAGFHKRAVIGQRRLRASVGISLIGHIVHDPVGNL
jgi:hypothetical protein